MKNLFIVFAIVFNSLVLASNIIDIAQQEEIVSFVAKVDRKYLWRAGHKNVSSSYSKVSARSFDLYLDRPFEEALESSEIKKIRNCLSNKECAVYNIRLQSDYYGGYGVDSVFVLIDLKSGKYDGDIKHNIYSE